LDLTQWWVGSVFVEANAGGTAVFGDEDDPSFLKSPLNRLGGQGRAIMPRPRISTEMRPSMPARKRWPCLKATDLS
jgi:hypothetical protein